MYQRLVEPSSGSINFTGKNVTTASKAELRIIRREIGMIFQQFNLVKNLSCAYQCALWAGWDTTILYPHFPRTILNWHTIIWKEWGSRNTPNGRLNNSPEGQQQRVAIARALMQKPKLILADEPVASLDPATADSIMHYLGEINNRDGITIICSLHFLSLARKYGNRVYALKDGKGVYEGLPTDIDHKRFKEIYGQDAQEIDIN
jgi:phosphonate transport system ATP-binding protein